MSWLLNKRRSQTRLLETEKNFIQHVNMHDEYDKHEKEKSIFSNLFFCQFNRLKKDDKQLFLLLLLVHLPLTISVQRGEVDNFFLPNFDLLNDETHSGLHVNHTDWYFISSNDLKMTMNSTMISSSSSAIALRPMPLAKALPVAFVLSSIVVLCICGNILVILSVFTFRPLRTVQNFFIVSLAFSDMLVAILVMPFHIVTHILDRWIFGKIFCQVFVTSDVLLCTSSILNLCAIAVKHC